MTTTPTPRLRPAPKGEATLASRLLIQIRKTVYELQVLGVDGSPVRQAFRLRKADGTVYDVALTEFGSQCDCPDFIFRREWLDPSGCKHVKALVAAGLLREAEPAARPRPARAGSFRG